MHIRTVSSRVDAYVALGSNIGNRAQAVHQALHELRNLGSVKCTSFLYETAPMYHVDQPAFLNAVCLLQTNLPPVDLMKGLQSIEQRVGRQESFRNGPRLIDLDILLYGNECINEPYLQVPHPRIAERAFVLRPLCDIVPPHATIPAGISMKEQHRPTTIHNMYAALPASAKSDIRRVMPMHNHKTNRTRIVPYDSAQQQPQIMGILNITPDRLSTLAPS